ncbi:CobW family GTP-binding protein [Luteibacter yeojuensis]|uniref:G3E family GTPase n=1 Tax=Luteibacter yeojuensis TaxID=345309 RepID=A0A0F3KUA3_9GAMM|nr:GTP-binding protein [Luteibacter yeojuensis]KJV34798.1 hypothetical protein VI08_09435 [Luteibacter yeojuensis]
MSLHGLLRPDVVQAAGPVDDRVPVTVLTGFLGAGKTTLINRVLATAEGERLLVIVNEFGDIGVDHALMAHAHDDGVIELAGGCVCCSRNGDLGRTLADAIWRFSRQGRRDFDAVVIETTGLATPETVTAVLHRDYRVAAHYRLNGVVTVIDASSVLTAHLEHAEISRQAGGADRIILGKADLSDPGALSEVRRWATSINPVADIVESAVTAPFELASTGWRLAPLAALPPAERHGDMPSATVVMADEIDPHAFATWLDLLLVTAGPTLLRLKGLVCCGPDTFRLAIHAVQGIVHPAARLRQKPVGQGSYLVLIGEALRNPAVLSLLDASGALFGATTTYRGL